MKTYNQIVKELDTYDILLDSYIEQGNYSMANATGQQAISIASVLESKLDFYDSENFLRHFIKRTKSKLERKR